MGERTGTGHRRRYRSHNLYTVCKAPALHLRHVGIAASLLVAYARYMEQEIARKQAALTSEWQGEIGQRAVFTLTCIAVRYADRTYRTTAIYKLVALLVNQFIWFSSRACLDMGGTYTLKATVKGHDTYKGVKQTVINRCTVIEESKRGDLLFASLLTKERRYVILSKSEEKSVESKQERT